MKNTIRSAIVDGQHRTAVYSPDEKYRYRLSICLSDQRSDFLTVIGLNPSTATELENDPTVRRCIGFAKAMGLAGLHMLNAFAYRATDPKKMLAQKDPIGVDNDLVLSFASGVVVAAWGVTGAHMGRDAAIRKMVKVPLHCWGVTKQGHPRHPLYLPSNAVLQLLGPS